MNFRLIPMITLLLIFIVPIVGKAEYLKRTELKPKEEPQQSVSPAPKGFIDFNTYYATGNSEIFTINILANLPHRFQYFSLNNFFRPNNRDRSFDINTLYSEQNLRWGLAKNLPLDLAAQWAMSTGLDNDRARLGLRWRLASTSWLKKFFKKINMVYSVTLFGLETDFTNQIQSFQIEHAYNIFILPKLLKKRVYVRGFADHNMRFASQVVSGNNHVWVTNHQFGVRLVDHFYFITEYRYNEFFPQKKHDVGIGLEYKIVLK